MLFIGWLGRDAVSFLIKCYNEIVRLLVNFNNMFNASELFSVKMQDVYKGLITAAFSAVLPIVISALNAGVTNIDWSFAGKVALAAMLGYISKNYLSDKNGKVLGRIG